MCPDESLSDDNVVGNDSRPDLRSFAKVASRRFRMEHSQSGPYQSLSRNRRDIERGSLAATPAVSTATPQIRMVVRLSEAAEST